MRFAIIASVADGNNDDGTVKPKDVIALSSGDLEDEFLERLLGSVPDVDVTTLTHAVRTAVRDVEATLRARTVTLAPHFK